MGTKQYQGDKAALIQEVQRLGCFWDAAASSQSISAVSSGKKEDLDNARMYVARANACDEMAKKIVEAIHRHFSELSEPPNSRPAAER